jgi:APA family basic amino acid/polyamine antiporter
MALGTSLVILLYLLANVAYLVCLPIQTIQTVSNDRVASATADVFLPGYGALAMALAIMVSTFGCMNGLILTGARAYFAMACDSLFFRKAGQLNRFHVPSWGLLIQGIWTALLILPRTISGANPSTGAPVYGNLYNDLLTYIMSAALIFYILTIAGLFRLRKTRAEAERPYKAFGYPVVPGLYILGAMVILCVLFFYQPATTWPGLVIVAAGYPIYLARKKWSAGSAQ